MSKFRFGDVLRDEADGEIVMVIAREDDVHARVITLSKTQDGYITHGSVEMRILDRGDGRWVPHE